MTTLAWTPSSRDRLIYNWVKFDGQKQSWVADQLNLSQSTVSRIIDRYERWIAHGGPAQEGSLSHDERRRAQNWLTFQRNEWILASCLRLAGEMEHMSDTSKSTTKHHSSDPSREIEVRTENSIRDRTAVASRYLRLAFRINMEQKKLVEQDDLPALEPFNLDLNEYSDAIADSRSGFQSDNTPFEAVPANAVPQNVVPSLREGHEAEPAFNSADFGATTRSELPPSERDNPRLPPRKFTADAGPPANLSSQLSSSLSPSPAEPPTMHSLHNAATAASPPTPTLPTTSTQNIPAQNSNPHAYALPQNPPGSTDQLDPILNATAHQSPPPIRVLPLHTSLSAP